MKVQSLEKVMSRLLISDRLWLKSIYESTAETLRIDGIVDEPVVRNSTDWNKIHKSVKAFIWSGMSTACPSCYRGLMEAIEREVPDFEGDLDKETRETLIESLERVAWAGLGKDE